MYLVDIFSSVLFPTKVSWKTVEKDGYMKKTLLTSLNVSSSSFLSLDLVLMTMGQLSLFEKIS